MRGDEKVPPGRTKDRLAPTHALRFVFADNDVFSDPSSKSQGGPDEPFNSRCQIAAAARANPWARRKLRLLSAIAIFLERMRNALLTGVMVEPDGIEPTTSCLQSTRSPS